jgi:hypothetical protein
MEAFPSYFLSRYHQSFRCATTFWKRSHRVQKHNNFCCTCALPFPIKNAHAMVGKKSLTGLHRGQVV